MKHIPLLPLLLLLCCLGMFEGCHPAYSSPIRVFNNTPPGRMKQQTIEITAAGLYPPGGAFSFDYALLDYLELRLGGDYLPYTMGTASLGWHASFWPAVRQESTVKFLNEIQLGFGGGVGGECDQEVEYCQQWPDKDWQDRLLLGMWVGAGVGLGIDVSKRKGLVWDLEIDIYLHWRFQYTDAKYAPATLWHTYGPGLAFRMQRFVRVYFSWAFVNYDNEIDSAIYGGFEFGLSFTFDLFPKKAAPVETQ